MSDFIDLYLDPRIPGWPCYSAPKFSTKITATASGDEHRNRNWRHPLRTFNLPGVIREHEILEALHDHWLVAGGPDQSFPFRDPLDFASIGLTCPNEVPAWSGLDQALGVGDGLTRFFQLEKVYQRGAFTYTRPIILPVTGSLSIMVNGIAAEDVPAFPLGGPYDWDVTRPGGVVEFDVAPALGLVLTWGGLFDCKVRFEGDDAYAGIVQSFGVSGLSDLVLKELRSC